MRTQKLHSRLPYSNEEATNPDFLLIGGEVGGISGMGMHSCWIADRRSKFLQLWPYGPLYRDGPTLPMLVGLPKSLQECSESERIYTSEIGGADNGNIAFCTSRGAVTSTDHRLYLQLLHPEDTERKEIVCFACKNVGRESERLILVVGTSDGDMIVTLKTRNGLYSEQISLAEKCEPQAILVPRAFSWKSWLPLPRKADRAPSPSHLSAGSPCRIVSVRKNSSEILSASEAIVCSFNFEFSSDQLRLNKRWSTNVLLGQSGAVLSIGECPGKVCVLLTAADSVGSSYSLLSLAVLNDRNGSFMHHISLSGNTTLIRSLDSVPLSHIKTFVFEGHSEITICCGNMILHAKNAENASNTPEAERVTVLNNLVGGVTSVVLDSGAIVSLDAQGPHLTVENVFHENELAGKAKGGEKLTFCGAKGPRGSSDFDRQLEELIAIAKVDSRTSLDDLILSTSETLFPGTAKKATGLWALSDMNDESDNILLRATINLKRGQQAHRCFLLAVLRHPQLLSSLRPETLGELISAQESLLVLSSLRALQNIGLLPETDGLAFSTLEMTHQIFGVSLFGSSTGRAMKVPLIQRQEQLLCCQKILRASLIRVAERHRSEGERGQPSADLVYSHPVFAVAMLEEVKAFLEECHQSALLTTQEKRLTAYAAACILVIACQTVVESREDIYRVWVMSREVSCHMWSDSETSKWSIKGLLGETAVLIARMSDGNKQTHDLLFFILFFICASHAPTKTKQTLSQLIKNTLLSFPFVESAFGYPLGPPKPTARYAAIGPQIIEAAETLALTFDIFDLLMDFSLSSPLSHSCIPESTFSLFVEYCKTNERFFSFALESLLLQKREWEVIYLPLAVSSQYPQARALGCQFLSERAPHLLWLVDSNRFDSLLYDGANPAPAVLYGPHQLSHRSRCTALAKLMHAAEGCPPSVFSGELEVSKSIVKAQEMYLMSSSANEVLGAQEVVQRLIALPSSVKAWVHAAQTASLLRDELSEDLLVQVLKRCKQEDGESLELFDSASERDTSIQLLQTASGQVIVNCRALQSISLLQRLGQQVYTKQELQLLLDWVEALFTGRASFHGGKH